MPRELTQTEEKFLEQITANNGRGGQAYLDCWRKYQKYLVFAIDMYLCLTASQKYKLILEIEEFYESTKIQNSQEDNYDLQLCIERLTRLRNMGVFTPTNRQRKPTKYSKKPQQKYFSFRACLKWVSESLRLSSPQKALKQDKTESSSIDHVSKPATSEKIQATSQGNVLETLKFNKNNENFKKCIDDRQDLTERLMNNIQL